MWLFVYLFDDNVDGCNDYLMMIVVIVVVVVVMIILLTMCENGEMQSSSCEVINVFSANDDVLLSEKRTMRAAAAPTA